MQISKEYNGVVTKKKGSLTREEWAIFSSKFLSATGFIYGDRLDLKVEFMLSSTPPRLVPDIDELIEKYGINITENPQTRGINYYSLELKNIEPPSNLTQRLREAVPQSLLNDALHLSAVIRPQDSLIGGHAAAFHYNNSKKSNKVLFETFWTPELCDNLTSSFKPLAGMDRSLYSFSEGKIPFYKVLKGR